MTQNLETENTKEIEEMNIYTSRLKDEAHI